MTLAQLREKVDAVKIGGRLPLSNEKLTLYQEMAFEAVTQLCYPLNLTIPYQDKDVYRPIDVGDSVEWFLKKPRIAVQDTDFVDIDDRLDLAMVYQIAAFMAADEDRVLLENRAHRICLEYACGVLRMGWSKAKEVYEEDTFIDSVRFDCVGRVYIVRQSFVDAAIECLLCGSVCLNAAQKKQLDLYSGYLQGGSVKPNDLEALRAVDIAVFLYLMNNIGAYDAYSTEQIGSVTTLFCAFEEIMAGGTTAESWVAELNKRIEIDLRG